MKEEKGFLRREVKQETLSGYYPGLLGMDKCSCSCNDSVGVLSKFIGSRETPEKKNNTLKI